MTNHKIIGALVAFTASCYNSTVKGVSTGYSFLLAALKQPVTSGKSLDRTLDPFSGPALPEDRRPKSVRKSRYGDYYR